MDVVILLALALVFVVIEMSLTFVAAERWRNYGIVDAVWSAGFAGLALLYHFAAPAVSVPTSARTRSEIFAAMVLFWSLRLGTHLFLRIKSHHPVEDVRYAELRREWGARTRSKMFGFYQLQGVLQVVLSVPFLLVALNHRAGPAPIGLGPFEWVGLALWTLGLLGESLADLQLKRFRQNPENRGRVCQAGLWNYSRHPNYFFEWLIWIGFAVFAQGAPWGWVAFLAPALMWHFLVNVTGIPMTEALSVKSKGDAYREYQRTTSAFIPWFKRT